MRALSFIIRSLDLSFYSLDNQNEILGSWETRGIKPEARIGHFDEQEQVISRVVKVPFSLIVSNDLTNFSSPLGSRRKRLFVEEKGTTISEDGCFSLSKLSKSTCFRQHVHSNFWNYKFALKLISNSFLIGDAMSIAFNTYFYVNLICKSESIQANKIEISRNKFV